MKFFFPDSQDMVDPTFDFTRETRAEFRVRQQDDKYAHEVFAATPFDGILVSMGIVEGIGSVGSAKYTLAQRHRLRRVGAREFFRLENNGGSDLKIMGDCGAFSYVKEKDPPFPTEDVVRFYEECGFDYGISVDHVILGFKADHDSMLPGLDVVPEEWRYRQRVTLERAEEFLALTSETKARFQPVGVAHGWSPASYAESFIELERFGFETIALGGLVPLKTEDILAILRHVDAVRKASTRIHLLGISRCEYVPEFARFGVTSFDSTSPLRKAFKDERANYYSGDRTYTAVRIPQVEANPRLSRQIKAGQLDQKVARRLEKNCLDVMAAFDRDEVEVDEAVRIIREYEQFYDPKKDRSNRYREVLEARPWKSCACDVCRSIGYHVILFRGAERNRRRGFHNLYVFNQRLKRVLEETR